MKMFVAALATATALGSSMALAQNPMVGGAEMFPDRNIVENAVNSADHTTLVAAVQAAGLVETLSGEGPFTVLAPTNDAFAMLPEGAVDNLLLPENLEQLQTVSWLHCSLRWGPYNRPPAAPRPPAVAATQAVAKQGRVLAVEALGGESGSGSRVLQRGNTYRHFEGMLVLATCGHNISMTKHRCVKWRG